MILDLPIPEPKYRLVALQQVRRKSRKGWLEISWCVQLCVDRAEEETGVNYGVGVAPTIARAVELALQHSQLRELQDSKVKPSLGDISDILNDLTI